MFDPAIDTANREHALLAALPEHKRAAVAQLLDLPAAYPLCEITGPCPDYCDDPTECTADHPTIGVLTAGQMLQEVISGICAAHIVFQVLGHYRIARPTEGAV